MRVEVGLLGNDDGVVATCGLRLTCETTEMIASKELASLEGSGNAVGTLEDESAIVLMARLDMAPPLRACARAAVEVGDQRSKDVQIREWHSCSCDIELCIVDSVVREHDISKQGVVFTTTQSGMSVGNKEG